MNTIRNNKFISELYMALPHGHWNIFENIRIDALKYQTRSEWKRNNDTAHRAASKNGWLDAACSHMKKYQPKWSYEKVLDAARNSANLKDFRSKYPGAYTAARVNNWVREVRLNYEIIGHRYNRCIYVIANHTLQQAYVGLTYKYDKRMQAHFGGFHKATSAIVKHTDTYHLQLTEYLPLEGAIQKEESWLNEYRLNFEMLNTTKTGGLGGSHIVWDFEKTKEIALTCSTKSEFRIKNPSAYITALRNNWSDLICNHMPDRLLRKPVIGTLENAAKVAPLCSSRTEFQEKYPSQYEVARKYNKLDELCSHMLQRDDWHSYELVLKQAFKFKTRNEFQRQSRGAYASAKRNNWLELVCTHMSIDREEVNKRISKTKSMGDYHTPYGVFLTLKGAAIADKTTSNTKTIWNRCNSVKFQDYYLTLKVINRIYLRNPLHLKQTTNQP
jgi:predicted GIY-YIG superfamily endonuclease